MRPRIAFLAVAVCSAVAACSSGDSIVRSGNDPIPTSTAETTIDESGDGDDGQSSDRSDDTTPDDTTPNGTTDDGSTPDGTTVPASTAAPTTTTPLDDLPACPVDALEGAGEPIEVLFWHGLTAETDRAIQALTEEYNADQSRVRVRLEPQGSYDETFDKYIQSSQASRPDIVLFPEYFIQQSVDSESMIPVGACIENSNFDTAPFQQSALATYRVAGVQWAMPFNVSNLVLYYNRSMFEAAGLDPDRPPSSLDEVREYSEAIVDSGAASYGIAVDSGVSAFGGWAIEQWFANAGEFYADNENGHAAPATSVLYDSPFGVELLATLQSMVQDGLAYYVGGNPSGQDNFLRLADRSQPAAMTIGSSATLGTIKVAVDDGLIPGITSDDIGVGPLPSPTGVPTALMGGGALYLVADHDDATAAAAWDFITFLVSAQAQSEWAARTGYVPVREDALDLEPLASTYVDDPRFKVAYDQLVGSPDVPTMRGPILGPQREVRLVTARAVATILEGGDAQTALADAAAVADGLIAEYSARN